ncbi:hypothetical protein DCC25_06770 [Auritidibacter sp. NML120636]|nr:hypothetical protein DCC25_06770 [Auritidibacter sp. NML120636]
MRPSKKTKIIRTAIDLIEAGSLDSVSYDALAQSSGLSKSGIIYHFPSREEMMRAVHQYMADQWEAELEAAGGGPAEQLTGSQRLRAPSWCPCDAVPPKPNSCWKLMPGRTRNWPLSGKRWINVGSPPRRRSTAPGLWGSSVSSCC